eukprot:CAMPEP_0176267616 /NCGR_PEP_ID=MMETSP0121_2-20121125/43250_1 /TAXON_ID=160619 /ORGANISM="Kryptoperidinium foliaceum, Strain CCMP 1326" /LENGTH=73 /DNA_ID=CAMNT_0017607683 /DNA_START=250 /DNA_END=468 /DNA_ORIENTATION=-
MSVLLRVRAVKFVSPRVADMAEGGRCRVPTFGPCMYMRSDQSVERIWECREVEHIEVATESLSVEDQCERFEK